MTKKEHFAMSLFLLIEDDTMPERTAVVSVHNKKCWVCPSGLKKQRKPKKHRGKNSCLEVVKLVEVDSRLSIKCTCHQTCAKVKYSSLYVDNYICSRCMGIAGYKTSVATLS